MTEAVRRYLTSRFHQMMVSMCLPAIIVGAYGGSGESQVFAALAGLCAFLVYRLHAPEIKP